jgi:hypothetical protein
MQTYENTHTHAQRNRHTHRERERERERERDTHTLRTSDEQIEHQKVNCSQKEHEEERIVLSIVAHRGQIYVSGVHGSVQHVGPHFHCADLKENDQRSAHMIEMTSWVEVEGICTCMSQQCCKHTNSHSLAQTHTHKLTHIHTRIPGGLTHA